MGEAIARFREMARHLRRHSDELFSCPECELHNSALGTLSKRCRGLLREFEAGRISPEQYAHRLAEQKRIAERRPKLGVAGQRRFAIVEWLPPSMNEDPPYSINWFAEEAAREALEWGRLFELAEPRIQALRKATAALRFDRTCGGYGAALERWQEAFDALAPFIEEPPADTGSSPKRKTGAAKQQTKRSRRGIGGRPEKFTLKFIREVVAARERYQKDAAKLRHPVQRLPEWLSDYFHEKGLPLSVLPSKDPKKPEEWRVRANRFWKAAKSRLRRCGN